MKAIILAGGSGDRLFPLSRKNYPKQFIHINKDRSIFQETITRNIPFCEEFRIVTNEIYQLTIESQLQVFQGLKAEIIPEKNGNGTAPAIVRAMEGLADDEQIFVLSSDLLIDSEGYSEAIYKAKELAADGMICLFGVRPSSSSTSYGYIRFAGDRVTRFIEKPSTELAMHIFADDDVLWNCGMFIATVKTIRQELEVYGSKVKKALIPGARISEKLSFDKLILEQSNKLSVVMLRGGWNDLADFESYERMTEADRDDSLIIQNRSENTTVINESPDQLVVVNGMIDSLIVNTPDAIYITDKAHADDIKGIIDRNFSEYQSHFELSPKIYRPWGTREVIRKEPGFRVRKIVIYPGEKLSEHLHEKRNEDYSVVSGILTVQLRDKVIDVHPGESYNIAPGILHKLRNNTDENVVLIEVDTGAEINEWDMVTSADTLPSLYQLMPAFKDYLWGGHRLKDDFKKDTPYEITAESWELSAHQDGQSVIANGQFAGMKFGDFIALNGDKVCGWKSETFDRFPILIKFIDAMNALSIQIHPDDDYAFVHENEFGKNEMWYVMDADPGAFLYCGLNRAITKDELRQRINDHTITEVLNKIPVKTGDVIYVPAGTIHAICAGILICEIQQNSNSTYRMYDYGRKDKNGNARPLHIEKALDVVNLHPYMPAVDGFGDETHFDRSTQRVLSSCKYFETTLFEIPMHEMIQMDDSSFKSIIVIDGSCEISVNEEKYQAKRGDSFFASAGRKRVHITGKCTLIVTNI